MSGILALSVGFAAALASGSCAGAHPRAAMVTCCAVAAEQELVRAGETLCIHHAFAAGERASELRGHFRSLPAVEAASDESVSSSIAPVDLYIGALPIQPGPVPNCHLAPSEDGGRTRHLIALSSFRHGDKLVVPFAFDSAPGSEIATQIASALATASGKGGCVDKVREAGGGRGRGVFAAGRDYAQGELVEQCPCLSVPDVDVPSGLLDCMFTSPKLGESLLVFGHGMLYNDGAGAANIGWSVPTDVDHVLTGEGLVQFFAKRSILTGEELLSSYGRHYWTVKGVEPW